MVAAASKLMRIQDLVLVASKCSVVTRFRDTIGLPGRFSSRLQPNHPTDDARGVLASVIDGLQYGSGDAVIGINRLRTACPPSGACSACWTMSSPVTTSPPKAAC